MPWDTADTLTEQSWQWADCAACPLQNSDGPGVVRSGTIRRN